MRKYFKDTKKAATIVLSLLLGLSIADGLLSVYFPNSAFVVWFDKFLSIGIAPLLIFIFGVAIGEMNKINSKLK
ncbi:hypothetical protein AB3Q54_06430 [Ligilactobacillus agilis]|uniref:hypothetical protein n=1 Tax=Ligilactobacillus agilis TaxID=1601 RepID=UPI0034E1C77D